MNTDVIHKKNLLRINTLKIRAKLSKKQILGKSAKGLENLVSLDNFLKLSSYLVFLSINNEVDTSELIKLLKHRNKDIFLPAFSNNKWAIKKFNNFSDLVNGPFGTKQPKGKVITVDSDISILPGIAFSKTGSRIGYGKGVYDRLLKNSKSYKIGICYDFQVKDKIVQEKQDVVVDALVTDKKVYLFNNNGIRK